MSKTLHELNERWGISLRKLKAMALAGDLNLSKDTSSKRPTTMRYYLKKGRHLTVEHCIELLRNPEIFLSLGEYERKARKQIAALGNVASEALDANSRSMIDLAARNDAECATKLARWIASIIPLEGCSYHYVAVRMMFNCPGHIFKEIYKVLPRAVLTARKHDILAGKCGSIGNHMVFGMQKQFDL